MRAACSVFTCTLLSELRQSCSASLSYVNGEGEIDYETLMDSFLNNYIRNLK